MPYNLGTFEPTDSGESNMLQLIKTYHARAVPAFTCYGLAAITLAGPAPALYIGLGLVMLGTAALFLNGETR